MSDVELLTGKWEDNRFEFLFLMGSEAASEVFVDLRQGLVKEAV